MEELIGIIGFSLGASLGASATRGLGEGVRPLVRNALKLSIRAWDATASAGAAIRNEAAAATDGEATSGTRGRGGRRGPQKIAIARS